MPAGEQHAADDGAHEHRSAGRANCMARLDELHGVIVRALTRAANDPIGSGGPSRRGHSARSDAGPSDARSVSVAHRARSSFQRVRAWPGGKPVPLRAPRSDTQGWPAPGAHARSGGLIGVCHPRPSDAARRRAPAPCGRCRMVARARRRRAGRRGRGPDEALRAHGARRRARPRRRRSRSRSSTATGRAPRRPTCASSSTAPPTT